MIIFSFSEKNRQSLLEKNIFVPKLIKFDNHLSGGLVICFRLMQYFDLLISLEHNNITDNKKATIEILKSRYTGLLQYPSLSKEIDINTTFFKNFYENYFLEAQYVTSEEIKRIENALC